MGSKSNQTYTPTTSTVRIVFLSRCVNASYLFFARGGNAIGNLKQISLKTSFPVESSEKCGCRLNAVHLQSQKIPWKELRSSAEHKTPVRITVAGRCLENVLKKKNILIEISCESVEIDQKNGEGT